MPHHANWHPKLHQSFLLYSYWKKRHSSKLNKKKLEKELENIRRQLNEQNIDHLQNNPGRPPLYQLKLAKSHLDHERRHAILKRQQHLDFRQEMLVLEGKKARQQQFRPSKEQNDAPGASANFNYTRNQPERPGAYHIFYNYNQMAHTNAYKTPTSWRIASSIATEHTSPKQTAHPSLDRFSAPT
jgi:hypothetical protein